MAAGAHPVTGQVLGGATHNQRCRDPCRVSWRVGRQTPAGSPVPAGRPCGPCHPLAPHRSGAHSWRDSSPPTSTQGPARVGPVGGRVRGRCPTPGEAPPPRPGPAPRALAGRPGETSVAIIPRLPLATVRVTAERTGVSAHGHLFFAVFTLERLRLRQRHCLPPPPTVRGGGWSPDPSRSRPASGPACQAREPGLPGTSEIDKCLMVRVLLLPLTWHPGPPWK